MTAFGLPSGNTADLSDTWVTFSSDQPLLAYGSVIDNLNSAGTYVAAASDSGGTAYSAPAPPAPTALFTTSCCNCRLYHAEIKLN